MTSELLVHDRDAVRVLMLNRPEKKNALSDALGWQVVAAVRAAAADDQVRVIGITGAGGAFCSGVELAAQRSTEAADGELSGQGAQLDDLGWVGRFLLTLRLDCDKPIVAGINGVAIGAGLALAMCADMRLASDAARLHPGYIRAGTSPDGGLSWTLPLLLGHERAMRFLLDPRMVDPIEAHALGMIGEVVAQADFPERFSAYCAQLAALPPLGVRQTKRLVSRAHLRTDLEAHLRDELRYAERGLDSEDGQEAVRAILEKRTPVFLGR